MHLVDLLESFVVGKEEAPILVDSIRFTVATCRAMVLGSFSASIAHVQENGVGNDTNSPRNGENRDDHAP